jgi:hypothetical protein
LYEGQDVFRILSVKTVACLLPIWKHEQRGVYVLAYAPDLYVEVHIPL